MKIRVPIFMAVAAMILAISFVIIPMPTSAAIADGTYELNYEMKEAHSENTSMADGYFTKPAKLTVKNGVQYIQMTVTGSNYIESLAAPSGPVEIISEDTTNFVRVVKFKVDGDLSKPLNMEMHIIVPDLYDMTHTARAVFDLSGVTQAKTTTANNVNKSTNSEKSSKSEVTSKPETKTVEKEEKADTKATNTTKNENTKEEQVAEETEEVDEAEATENVEADAKEEDVSTEEEDSTSSEEVAASEVKDAQEDDSSSVALWISLIVVVVIIAGFVFWQLRKRKNLSRQHKKN